MEITDMEDLSQDNAIDNFEDDTEEVKNFSDTPRKFEVDGMRITLKAGQTIRIHKNYTRKQKMSANRDPVQSAIELMTNGNVRPTSSGPTGRMKGLEGD